jgi:putative ABC transport system permease protein
VVLNTIGALAAGFIAYGLLAGLALRVGRRRRELAIRLALGATERSLRLVILRHAFGLLLPSIALGLAGAGVAARLMQSQLFEVSAFDPAAFAAAAAISLIVGVAAAYVPARSAARVDPVALLRAE